MTKDPAKIAAIGLIAFLLALVSLGTVESDRRSDGSATVELSTRNDDKEKAASSVEHKSNTESNESSRLMLLHQRSIEILNLLLLFNKVYPF